MHPGVSFDIPTGARFQFRNTGPDPLSVLISTMPPLARRQRSYPGRRAVGSLPNLSPFTRPPTTTLTVSSQGPGMDIGVIYELEFLSDFYSAVVPRARYPLRRVAGCFGDGAVEVGSLQCPPIPSRLLPTGAPPLFSPNTMVPQVASPMNSIRPPAMSKRVSLPSAKPYRRCPSGIRPIDSKYCLGTRQSIAPVSTRKLTFPTPFRLKRISYSHGYVSYSHSPSSFRSVFGSVFGS